MIFLHIFHTQLYLAAYFVDSGYSYLHSISDTHYLRWITHVFISHLRYVHKSVILESYINKGPECDHIPHDPIENIPFFHIFHRDLFPCFGMSGACSFLDSYL